MPAIIEKVFNGLRVKKEKEYFPSVYHNFIAFCIKGMRQYLRRPQNRPHC